jgi:hypothetical protein
VRVPVLVCLATGVHKVPNLQIFFRLEGKLGCVTRETEKVQLVLV